ncbi:MAG: hypothetical protein A3H57_03010 [Candidatus Taylorbacteria bacterium RIFCSPLOWO2_02_FULL_43_11]|uniref:DUF4342 domain-containing protein n=1 Tax=Candidatus Taylorbacteria bacterium RIFCSPHIGHO2_02_FULL_43_32b TaxID=1802306 RepID=A0A1G2MLC5_9BACT|nr:MAG: hypothetical protein A2743_03105 [Candidatus Taylorbacteria bacterium RIFCSPHIGHO2_01_FULL_43_47]OHA23812.1 MAG: hypothetical protein A3C72_00835 [Candidatus Taylorbacteria bacterium RIFCSPHIGHO2_02_FULL_43_32b]OHA30674.1 MAG: hypothetical protein A3B08_02635 [Candidatus Taylorbacteria bacterium RIFCSPLOWO2_01_FULL_43_44]OHA37425.1 MAG: hypothetical protein A3H57_03010 [Candidatus Taylorbacteria bacterium RIFCSPLOWO2_02_FULL_43_11]
MEDEKENNEAPKEEFKVSGEELLAKVKAIIKEGNARRIIIKNEKGDTIVEIPVILGAVGALIAPALAVVGTIAALVAKCTIVVIKKS